MTICYNLQLTTYNMKGVKVALCFLIESGVFLVFMCFWCFYAITYSHFLLTDSQRISFVERQ